MQTACPNDTEELVVDAVCIFILKLMRLLLGEVATRCVLTESRMYSCIRPRYSNTLLLSGRAAVNL